MSCATELDGHWSYDTPSKWHKHFPAAAGTCQSPINIRCRQVLYKHFPLFEISPDTKRHLMFTLTNNGHQVTATLSSIVTSDKQLELSLTGGGLAGKFHFVDFHLHWGKSDYHGSEHEIEGYKFPAEAHVVYKNSETQQMAVFAFFLRAVHSPQEENSEWKKYSHIASLLTKAGETMDCTLDLSHIMQIESRRFFRYTGSLTTPPCTEGIIWTIFIDSIPMSEESLNLLRHNLLRKTYRPVQPINHRVIYRNYDD